MLDIHHIIPSSRLMCCSLSMKVDEYNDRENWFEEWAVHICAFKDYLVVMKVIVEHNKNKSEL